jgi:hypothetical protein
MGFEHEANQDFERAVLKGFMRKVASLFKKEDNQLLPYDEVRQKLPIKGQHYRGFEEVPINKIVGSFGRYRDFDRAFLPTQRRTRQRWVNIDKAHLQQEHLPAVELYKMGEAYFVKDGNHRISVAKERGQEFIDAYVTEIDIPVPLSPDIRVDQLELKRAYAALLEKTGIQQLRSEAQLEATSPEQYARLLEHIDTHRWYLGEKREGEVAYVDAAASWYDSVYMPIVNVIRQNKLLKEFSGVTETDLYLWIMEYSGYLREAYRYDNGAQPGNEKEEAVRHFLDGYPIRPLKKLISYFKKAPLLEEIVMQQEEAAFYERTGLTLLRKDARVRPSLPIHYDRLFEHIEVHRWYLGEQRGGYVPFSDAVASWFDSVYLPLVQIIREQDIMAQFTGRTEADLYLWIMQHKEYLAREYQTETALDQAAKDFTKRRKK